MSSLGETVQWVLARIRDGTLHARLTEQAIAHRDAQRRELVGTACRCRVSVYGLREVPARLVRGKREIRYVGATSRKLAVRLEEHWRTSEWQLGGKAAWLRELRAHGRKVEIVFLDMVIVDAEATEAGFRTDGRDADLEQRWIWRLRKAGHRLTNTAKATGIGTPGLTGFVYPRRGSEDEIDA